VISTEECRPTGGTASNTTGQVDTPDPTGSTGQLRPVGPHPSTDVLLVGSLLWWSSSPTDAADVLRHVRDDDISSPALATVLAAIRLLAQTGRPCGPQLVADELRRAGTLTRAVADQLRAATTCGADPLAASHYAAAMVAESLRRRIDSAGHALMLAAQDAAEAELVALVEQTAALVSDCGNRLAVLRGEMP
jgi:replicative DNA helicase